MMRGRAKLVLEMDEVMAELVERAVLPEVRSSPSDRAGIRFMRAGSRLVVEVEARDGSSLRAATSSVMRWIRLAQELGG